MTKELIVPKLREDVVTALSNMLDEYNVLVKSFRMASDAFISSPNAELRLRFNRNRTRDARQYNPPTASEVARLIVSSSNVKNFQRDIIVQYRTNNLKRITNLHPSFMSLTYPLLFPYGEDGYMVGILLRDTTNRQYKRQVLSIQVYYCLRLQQRLDESHTLLLFRRLLQQFIVDAYMAIEEEQFCWIRTDQEKLQADLYSSLMNAIHRGDSDNNMLGKSIILTSSHAGGPRYRVQNYQDAMTICRWAGYPDYFIKFTCNPHWLEIEDMLRIIGQEKDSNHVDIVHRVFEIKLQELMDDIKN